MRVLVLLCLAACAAPVQLEAYARFAPPVPNPASGDRGGIGGQVRDAGSNETLSDAVVKVTGSFLPEPAEVLTDDDGRYYLGGLPPGSYTVTVYHEDHTVVQPRIRVHAGWVSQVSLFLPPRAPIDLVQETAHPGNVQQAGSVHQLAR